MSCKQSSAASTPSPVLDDYTAYTDSSRHHRHNTEWGGKAKRGDGRGGQTNRWWSQHTMLQVFFPLPKSHQVEFLEAYPSFLSRWCCPCELFYLKHGGNRILGLRKLGLVWIEYWCGGWDPSELHVSHCGENETCRGPTKTCSSVRSRRRVHHTNGIGQCNAVFQRALVTAFWFEAMSQNSKMNRWVFHYALDFNGVVGLGVKIPSGTWVEGFVSTSKRKGPVIRWLVGGKTFAKVKLVVWLVKAAGKLLRRMKGGG